MNLIRNCYECEECHRNIDPSDAIPTCIDGWDGEVVQLHICPECSELRQFDPCDDS
jgi:hypothetical protein